MRPRGFRPQGGRRLAGAPASEARSFVVTEVGGWWLLDEDAVSGGNDAAVACDVGWLRNLDERNALGGVVFSEVGGFARLGVKARYRRWLSRTLVGRLLAGIGSRQQG